MGVRGNGTFDGVSCVRNGIELQVSFHGHWTMAISPFGAQPTGPMNDIGSNQHNRRNLKNVLASTGPIRHLSANLRAHWVAQWARFVSRRNKDRNRNVFPLAGIHLERLTDSVWQDQLVGR